ncbi:MAG: hypothetical protein H0U10_14280, partial [Chloroflexia bacterium]|nr:hypothetical protein [Chloroflexia bacterium]
MAGGSSRWPSSTAAWPPRRRATTTDVRDRNRRRGDRGVRFPRAGVWGARVSGTVDARGYLDSQPTERRIPDALEEIRRRVEAGGRRIAVLDDDPTGTQTVHGVPVLTTWSVEDLRWALEQPSPTFYVLTNSRSLPEEEAVAMNREVATNLAAAAERTGTDFVVTSRGDSTLRGHFPAETDALAEGLGGGIDGVILCPCYLEAGRLTADDTHWVRQGERLVPAGETEFARDAS